MSFFIRISEAIARNSVNVHYISCNVGGKYEAVIYYLIFTIIYYVGSLVRLQCNSERGGVFVIKFKTKK